MEANRRALPLVWQACSWCMLGNDLGPCIHFTPTTVEPPHERQEVPHHWRRLGTAIRQERAGESGRGRSRWARGWPPPDSMGFRWETLGSSDGLNSWTRHHASPHNAACVVSGKVARPIKATSSWKLPVVGKGLSLRRRVDDIWFMPLSHLFMPHIEVAPQNPLYLVIFNKCIVGSMFITISSVCLVKFYLQRFVKIPVLLIQTSYILWSSKLQKFR